MKKIKKDKKKKVFSIKKSNNIAVKEIIKSEVTTNNTNQRLIKKKNNTLNSSMSLNKSKKDFINEIKNLREKNFLSEESFKYLNLLINKLSNENNILDIPEKKMIELEISNRRILDWQKNRFEANKGDLKEKTKLKIGTLFEDFDDYMWKGKLASFSELRALSRVLGKKI